MTAEDTLIVAWREARAKARTSYDQAMADADKIYQQYLDAQRDKGTRGAVLPTAAWEDRLAALQVLAEATLRMRKPGDWHVEQRVAIGGDGILGSPIGKGRTPREALEEHWRIYTTLPEDRYIVLLSDVSGLRRARWDGDTWRTWTETNPEQNQ